MAIVPKSYTDYCFCQLDTWTELISTTERNYLDYCYVINDFVVRNITTGTTWNAFTNCAVGSDFEIEFVKRVVLNDWTTLTLVKNADFTEFPATIIIGGYNAPRFWASWSTCGPLMEIKQDNTNYKSSPSSVVFSGGNNCPAGTTGIRQKISIRDVAQLEGTFRLMFAYMSSIDNIYILPQITYYKDGVANTGAVFPVQVANASSTAWHYYDETVTVDVSDKDVDTMELQIAILNTATGTYTFNIDDVDFHYGFDLTAPYIFPSRPSLITPGIATDFDRAVDRSAHLLVSGGGNKKYRGSFNFNLVSEAQAMSLKAAWAFKCGHRFNVLTVWPNLVDKYLPEVLSFYWNGDWEFGHARMAGDMYAGRVPVEEV